MRTLARDFSAPSFLRAALKTSKTKKIVLADHMGHTPAGITSRLSRKTRISPDYLIKAAEFMGVKIPANAFVDVERDPLEPPAGRGAEKVGDAKPEFDTNAEVDRLANIRDEIARDIAIRDAAMDLGVTRAVLRKSVERRAAEARGDAELTAAAKVIREVEPADHSVDGRALADGIRAAFNRHLHLPEHADVMLTLWAIASHSINDFPKYPYIILTSAEPNCGKSEVQKVLRHLLQRAALASGMTGAVIFRVMDAYAPALLLDEVDQWLVSDEGQSINAVINGAHDKETAVIWRCVGDNHEPTPFNTWGPKVFSGIGDRARTLSSRGHIVSMMRAPPDAKFVELESDADKAVLHDLASKAARWAMDHGLRAKPDMPAAVINRARDNWRPLFAVANLVGSDWPELVKAAADHAIEEEKEYADESLGLKLIRDCIDIIKRRGRMIDGEIHLQSTALRDELVGIDDAPWAHFKNDKPISPRSIAFILKPYKIIPRKKSDGNYWRLSMFENAFFVFSREETSRGYPEQAPSSSIPPESKEKQEPIGWKKGDSIFHEKDPHPPSIPFDEKWRMEWRNDGTCDESVSNCNQIINGGMELDGGSPEGGSVKNAKTNKEPKNGEPHDKSEVTL